MNHKILLFSLLSVLSLVGCGTSTSSLSIENSSNVEESSEEVESSLDVASSEEIESSNEEKAQKMTEDEFNNLINKIETQGMGASFNTIITNEEGGVLLDTSGSFKCDVETYNIEEITFDGAGNIMQGSILKDLTNYQYNNKTGEWVEIGLISKEAAQEIFQKEFLMMFKVFFPISTYSDYNFDENDGTYSVDKIVTTSKELHYEYTYTMDANGISKIEGSATGYQNEILVTQTVTINSFDIGAQTIEVPVLE